MTADERTGDGFCSVVVDRWTDVAEGPNVKETCLAEICNVMIHGKTFVEDDTKKFMRSVNGTMVPATSTAEKAGRETARLSVPKRIASDLSGLRARLVM